MNPIEIIPAIDIIDGQCVRLTRGDYATRKVYGEDPVLVAKDFEDAGIRRLHVVDLDGARSGHIVNAKVLEAITTSTSLHVDFGGGIKTDQDIELAFNSGASQVTGGSIAVSQRSLFISWIQKYGPERIILGADVRDEMVSISGWQQETGMDLSDFLNDYQRQGIRHVVCTDIACDGMLEGPSTDLYARLVSDFPLLRMVASGGVSSMDDIRELQKTGVWGVIVGKALYEGRININELVNEFIG